MRKLWVDDERAAPSDEWIVARNYKEAADELDKGVDVVSLDHDLGDYDGNGNELTGYSVACKIEEMAFHGEKIPQVCFVHSANPSGADRIVKCLVAICNCSAPSMSIRQVDAETFRKNSKDFVDI